jgi:hypothetical protein
MATSTFLQLFNPRPATLDQNNQDNDKQDSGDDPDYGCGVHLFPFPSFSY